MCLLLFAFFALLYSEKNWAGNSGSQFILPTAVFWAFTKGESRILFRSIVGQQRTGIFAVLLFLYVGFSNSFVLQFCSCIQQWIITLQSPIVSIKRIIFAAERKTVGNEILTTRQKGSSKLLWDSFFPPLVYTFAECRPP